MVNIVWDKFNDDSLEFIFEQSTKLLSETFDSVRESSNKSFLAVAVYSGLLSFCFNKAIEYKDLPKFGPYVATGVGLIAAIIVIIKNLLPRKMIFVGTQPSKLLDDFFTETEVIKRQKKEMMITRLIDQEKAISNNLTQSQTMANRFNVSAIIFLFSLFLGVTISLI